MRFFSFVWNLFYFLPHEWNFPQILWQFFPLSFVIKILYKYARPRIISFLITSEAYFLNFPVSLRRMACETFCSIFKYSLFNWKKNLSCLFKYCSMNIKCDLILELLKIHSGNMSFFCLIKNRFFWNHFSGICFLCLEKGSQIFKYR